jgi:hypothetical protein
VEAGGAPARSTAGLRVRSYRRSATLVWQDPIQPETYCRPNWDDEVGSRGRDAAEIQATLRRHRLRIQHCYDELLGRDGNARGSFLIGFVIASDGTVQQSCAKREGTFNDQTAARCVLHEIDQVRFSASDGPVAVVFPIRFASDMPVVPYAPRLGN